MLVTVITRFSTPVNSILVRSVRYTSRSWVEGSCSSPMVTLYINVFPPDYFPGIFPAYFSTIFSVRFLFDISGTLGHQRSSVPASVRVCSHKMDQALLQKAAQMLF